jgi:WD40 repeat protein
MTVKIFGRICLSSLIVVCLISSAFAADDGSVDIGDKAVVYKNRIEVKGVGAPPKSSDTKELATNAAGMAAMICALRNFGESLYEMKKFILEYETGLATKDIEKRCKDGSLEKTECQKEKDEALRRYNIFLEYKGLFSKYPTLEIDYGVASTVGNFNIRSEYVVKDHVLESDAITVQLPDSSTVKVNNYELVSTDNIKHYEKIRSAFRENSLDEKFVIASDGTAEFTLICKAPLPVSTGLSSTEEKPEIYVPLGHRSTIYSSVFSPNGNYIVTGGEDDAVRLWDAATGMEIRTFFGHTRYVRAVAVSPDNRYILSGGEDKKAILWRIDTGKAVINIDAHKSFVVSTGFSPDGLYMFTACNMAVNIWHVPSGKLVSSLAASRYPAAFTPDGKWFIAGSKKGMTVWNVSSWEPFRKIEWNVGNLQSIAISPDGRYLATGSDYYYNEKKLETVRMWDITTGDLIWKSGEQDYGAYAVSFSPDGKNLAASYGNGRIMVLEAETGKLVHDLRNRGVTVFSVSYSPDGARIMADVDRNIHLWDARTGKLLGSLGGEAVAIKTAQFSPNGRYAISEGRGCRLYVWDMMTGREERIIAISKKTDGEVCWDYYQVIRGFSPDSRFISTSDQENIYIWDLATGRQVKSTPLSQSQKDDPNIRKLSFCSENRNICVSPKYDGPTLAASIQYLVIHDSQNRILLRDASQNSVDRTLAENISGAPSMALSGDGKRLIIGSIDGSSTVIDIESGREVIKFFHFKNGEWLGLTPEGYFTASRNGPSHFNIRRGNRAFNLDQFYDVFYRPDIVEAKLKGEDIALLAVTNLEEALKNPPPKVEFLDIPTKSSSNKVTIKYRVSTTGGGIGEIRLFHNGKLIQSDGFYRQTRTIPIDKAATLLAYNSRAIKDDLRSIAIVSKKEDKVSPIESAPKNDVYEGVITIDAISGDNDIGLAAFNRNNTIQSILRTATFESTIKPEEPHLYVLSVGIDEYRARENNLKFAVKDAESIVQKIQAQAKTQYKPENIHGTTIKNIDATKTNILNRMNELSKVIKPNDVFMLFIASHGVLQSGLYSIVTHDYKGSLNNDNLINSNEIMEISKKIKALTQIFILDTCHAGGLDNFVSGLYDARMTVIARNMGLHIFASASSTQEALDGYKGNGLFTYTLLDGLNNNKEADKNKEGKVSIVGLGEYSKRMTTNISKQIGHEQTPLIINFGKDSPLYKLQ